MGTSSNNDAQRQLEAVSSDGQTTDEVLVGDSHTMVWLVAPLCVRATIGRHGNGGAVKRAFLLEKCKSEAVRCVKRRRETGARRTSQVSARATEWSFGDAEA